MKYRKKPVVIEAYQWKDQRSKEWPAWLKGACEEGVFKFDLHLGPLIETLEGDHHVSEDDFIIQGVKGEIYPCKPDIFEMTYEEVIEKTPGCRPFSIENNIDAYEDRIIAKYDSKDNSNE